MMKIKTEVIQKKKKAKQLKEKGNSIFKKKQFELAEKFYSKAIELNMGSRPLWTNRAICRNAMKNHEGAISDCDSALTINPKCVKSIVQKGNALMCLGLFEVAKAYFESLRPLGEGALADTCLKKLQDAQFQKPVPASCQKQKANKKKLKKNKK